MNTTISSVSSISHKISLAHSFIEHNRSMAEALKNRTMSLEQIERFCYFNDVLDSNVERFINLVNHTTINEKELSYEIDNLIRSETVVEELLTTY